ncbi:hypothetical protein Sjap_002604 [Stephania japonica]|uniref:Metallo-beta-lactamase domain-containing protein n=1 Tax=Stephania japonica TaxID=461633 RepID=A0AAP0PUP1_9MAGN
MESANLTENGTCLRGEEMVDARSSLLFLGTGCSSAVPNVMCLIQPYDPPCQVCSQALSIPPEHNLNYRCNTSLLIDYLNDDGEHKYILIDVGKTFREQVLRWFTRHKIPRVDSIILTHEHADAVFGLDDVRVVQPFSPTNDIEPTPIHLSQFAMERSKGDGVVDFPSGKPRNSNEFLGYQKLECTPLSEERAPFSQRAREIPRAGHSRQQNISYCLEFPANIK